MIAATVTNGNSSREVTAVFAAGWSGIWDLYIVPSSHDYEGVVSAVVEFILAERDTPSNFHSGGMEGGWGPRSIHRKRKIGRIAGLVMNFRSRENLWDRYVCVYNLFSLCPFFFLLTNDDR